MNTDCNNKDRLPSNGIPFTDEEPDEEGVSVYEHHRLTADSGQKPMRIDKFLMEHLYNTSRNRLQRAAEQEFILAEAALRGWTDDDPETHYLNGIRAAHEFLGVSSADTRAYLGHEKVQFKGSDTEKLGKIITEKYLNFFMQGGNEAYFELRRTGYPDFSAYLTHNTDQIYNDGYLPLRYRYPQSEIDNNNAQVSEAIKRLDKGDDRNSRMWLLQGSDPLFNPAPFPFRYKN